MSILITSVLNTASDKLAISSSLSCFLEFWSVLSFGPYFFVLGHLLICKGQSLRYSPGWAIHANALWHCMWGRGPRGSNATCSALRWLSVTSPTTLKQIGPFWCWFLGGWVCVWSRTPWAPPKDSPVRLGIPLTTTNPTGFYTQMFWGFLFPSWNPGLCSLSGSPVVPPGLSTHEWGTDWSTSSHLASHPLHPSFLSRLLFPVWINVSSLTPGLLDFYSVQFSGSCGCTLFSNWLLSFWLYTEVKHIYLCLHLVQKLQYFPKHFKWTWIIAVIFIFIYMVAHSHIFI